MICLLLIMTMVFINGTESAKQNIRHLDTLMKEEEMSAKTKTWLFMIESGKMDQDEPRRITPKSIFIAPLLTSGAIKCQEGYRHDHLGQCVKVIKIDPKAQLELLLQRLNKLYAEKNEEKEVFEISNGPLQFSLPISNADDQVNASQNGTKLDRLDFNGTASAIEVTNKTAPEFIPIPLPLVLSNQTNEMESSGAEPLNDTTPYEISEFEGSGVAASGDETWEEETTTESPISLLFDETDYVDTKDSESTTVSEIQSTTEPPREILTTTPAEENATDSYENNIAATTLKANATDLSGETIPVHEQVFVKSNPNLDKIVFPDDESLRTRIPEGSSAQSSTRIRFPDEVPQLKSPSYQSIPDADYKFDKYQIHTSVIPQEQFWWLPKNWQIDENQQKSALVKVWSRLPLIHDITYSQPAVNGFKSSNPLEQPYPQGSSTRYEDDSFSLGNNHQRSRGRSLRRFQNSRFQDMVQTQRQNFRIQR